MQMLYSLLVMTDICVITNLTFTAQGIIQMGKAKNIYIISGVGSSLHEDVTQMTNNNIYIKCTYMAILMKQNIV